MAYTVTFGTNVLKRYPYGDTDTPLVKPNTAQDRQFVYHWDLFEPFATGFTIAPGESWLSNLEDLGMSPPILQWAAEAPLEMVSIHMSLTTNTKDADAIEIDLLPGFLKQWQSGDPAEGDEWIFHPLANPVWSKPYGAGADTMELLLSINDTHAEGNQSVGGGGTVRVAQAISALAAQVALINITPAPTSDSTITILDMSVWGTYRFF